MNAVSATIAKEDDKWVVIVIEEGAEVRQDFKFREYAMNWLEGQRTRLGLCQAALTTDDAPRGRTVVDR
jgi:hypothetical protein